MFGGDDNHTKTVYRIRSVILLLLLMPFVVAFEIALYLSSPTFALPLIPETSFPVTSWVICIFYPLGLKLISLSAPFTSFATYSVITTFTILLIAAFVVSWVSFTTLIWDIPLLGYLKDVKGYERYGDAKRFVRSLVKEGTTKEKIMVILGPILIVVGCSLMTAALLSMVMLYNESIRSTLISAALMVGIIGVLYGFRLKKFAKNLALQAH